MVRGNHAQRDLRASDPLIHLCTASLLEAEKITKSLGCPFYYVARRR